MLRGLGVSPGIEIGKAFMISNSVVTYDHCCIKQENVSEEIERLKAAFKTSEEQINMIIEKIDMEKETEKHQIFMAHLEIIRDPVLTEKGEKNISNKFMSAEQATAEVINEFALMMEAMEDPVFVERAADIRDIGNRVLKNLVGIPLDEDAPIHQTGIIIADDLTPSMFANLDRSKVLAIVTGTGGKTSHVAIMARCMGIPAVAGLGDNIRQIAQGDLVIVDGYKGHIIVNPGSGIKNQYLEKIQEKAAEDRRLEAYKNTCAVTSCKLRRVEVSANIAFAEECEEVLKNGAEGVGLYRTEFLYMDQKDWPDEETQFQEYKKIISKMAPLPVIVRTLDIGGDKNLPYMGIPHEDNPFLGLRAIRLCFARPEMFLTQLRALLRASVFGKMRIMFPMISSVEEVRKAKEFIREAKRQLEEKQQAYDDNIEIGIMVEIPSAAIAADTLAQEVDFFSIGTNDLVQYTVACDRMNKEIASLYDYFNPAVLMLIKNVIEASHKYCKWTGMCGEMAGSLEAAAILVGLGLDEFSMSASAIPRFKEHLSKISYSKAVRITEKAFELATAGEIREMINEEALAHE